MLGNIPTLSQRTREGWGTRTTLKFCKLGDFGGDGIHKQFQLDSAIACA
jgi:hypothetical protein